MPLTATDLPEPVVPATSRCGIFDRFTLTGAPLMSLPSADLQLRGRPGEAAVLQDLLQVDDLAGRVRHLDADHRLARDRGHDADRLRLERHRQILLEVLRSCRCGCRARARTRTWSRPGPCGSPAPCRARRSSTSPARAARPCRRAAACRCRASAGGMYSSSSVPGSWKAPSPSLMKPSFSPRSCATSAPPSAWPAAAASSSRRRAADAGSTMMGASAAGGGGGVRIDSLGSSSSLSSSSASAAASASSPVHPLDGRDLGDDLRHRRALGGELLGHGARRADPNALADLLRGSTGAGTASISTGARQPNRLDDRDPLGVGVRRRPSSSSRSPSARVRLLGLAAAAPLAGVVLLRERRPRHPPGGAGARDDAVARVPRRPGQHHRDLAHADLGDQQQRRRPAWWSPPAPRRRRR